MNQQNFFKLNEKAPITSDISSTCHLYVLALINQSYLSLRCIIVNSLFLLFRFRSKSTFGLLSYNSKILEGMAGIVRTSKKSSRKGRLIYNWNQLDKTCVTTYNRDKFKRKAAHANEDTPLPAKYARRTRRNIDASNFTSSCFFCDQTGELHSCETIGIDNMFDIWLRT